MKKTNLFAVATAAALTLSACGGEATDAPAEGAAEETTETAAAEDCNEETLVAKATEVGEKMKELANDPEAMQAMAAKLQEVQAQAQEEGYDVAAACAVYDEMLAEG